jgi:hypothetical protein
MMTSTPPTETTTARTIIEMVNAPWGTLPPGVRQLSTMRHVDFPMQEVVLSLSRKASTGNRSARRMVSLWIHTDDVDDDVGDDRLVVGSAPREHERLSTTVLSNTPWGTIPSWLGESSTLRLWSDAPFKATDSERTMAGMTGTSSTQTSHDYTTRAPGGDIRSSQILKESKSKTSLAWIQTFMTIHTNNYYYEFTGTISRSQLPFATSSLVLLYRHP